MSRSLLVCLAIAGLLVNTACVNVVFEGSDKRLRMTPEQVLDTGEDISGVIVWGGHVLSVNQGTDWIDIEVLAFPLDAANRPRTNEMPVGRFVASYPGDLQPLKLFQGQLVSLAGELQGFRQGQIDDVVYQFPAVMTTRIHIWDQENGR
jgi:outer membrane lipoprotein